MSNIEHSIEVRDLRSGDWFWSHKNILFSEYIPDAAFRVYCVLASFAGNANQRSWPSMQTIASKLHRSRISVARSVKTLEASGLVRVTQRPGTSHIYELLDCNDITAPRAPKIHHSAHHKLVGTFHEASIKFRGVKPVWGPKETSAIKRALKSGVVSADQLEQLAIYFLAHPRFKKFGPSASVFLSSGILNGLMNAMQNDKDFWKDVDRYGQMLYERSIVNDENVNGVAIAKLIADLQVKMKVTI